MNARAHLVESICVCVCVWEPIYWGNHVCIFSLSSSERVLSEMDYCDEFLRLNELVSESSGNLTGVLEGLVVLDTRDRNFHPLNNRFAGGFLLLSQWGDVGQGEKASPGLLVQDRVAESLQTRISDQDGLDSIKLCICRDLNSAMSRNCLFGLLKHYSQILGINSQGERFEDTSQEVAVFKMNYEYLVLESNLNPLSFKKVRDLLYLLNIRQVKLHSRFVFYVRDEQESSSHCKAKFGPQNQNNVIVYLVLDPRRGGDDGFDLYAICNPTGLLASKVDLENNLSANKIAVSEIIPIEPASSCAEHEVYSVVSRFDIYSDSSPNGGSSSPDDNTALHNKLNRSKCINMFPGTCFSLLVRWSLGTEDALYPSIPKLNPANIDEGLIFLKIDITQIKDPSLVSVLQGLEFLELLINSNSENCDPTNSGTGFEHKDLQIIVLRFIKRLSKIWGYSILDRLDPNKEDREEDHLEIDGRIDADYTDLLWGFLASLREERLIFNVVLRLLDELEKSCSHQLYENRFIPQIRRDNTTVFSKLVRTAVDIYKENQYLGQKYESTQDPEKPDLKKKFTQWESIRKTYFGDFSVFKFVLMEIGFECLIADMKMHVRKSEPLLDESSFNWHLNDLYSDSKKLLQESNLSGLEHTYRELLLRLRKLLPVCYISNILKTCNCSWDVSKKLIRSTIKYYSNQHVLETHPIIFVAPIFNKAMISQIISSNSPNQIVISPCPNTTSGTTGSGLGGAICLNKVDSIELPNLDSDLSESILMFNKFPVCIWKTLSDPEGSRPIPNHFTIQVEKNLTQF